MHTDIHYTSNDRAENDQRAIADLESYVGQNGVARLKLLAEAGSVVNLSLACAFAGITGYSFHAFARKYCLDAYRAWLLAGDSDGPIHTDVEGFIIKHEPDA